MLINSLIDRLIELKVLNLTFEDEEWDALKRAKGAKTWRAFILQLVKQK